MSNFVADQLGFVRRQAVDYVRNINDPASELIPTGLKNNIKWNLGHMYVIHEKFAFQLTGEETKYPASFSKLFDSGTKPSDWTTVSPPLSQIIDLLIEQIERVESVLSSKLKEEINPHYKSSTGLYFTNVEQLLGFLIYHEAMHFATIKNIKSIIDSQD
ncbi:DinB family protein [Paenibacillus silvae]|uniref:DinB family protein n=1 Tax=Paenibacillus silvae TaxID=1325358 RepID=UPI0011A3F828|nr:MULTISPECIES: DinB family protein [Paenibacillus]MCK6078172.1 DinB family protein [Paenibacillus silvae]MCK6152514.1 DinB family protein [Paenibacillus silvae]MCK6271091.1 DinB family protein [Paenibacillus silvae]